MKKKAIGLTVLAIGAIALSYSACSPFHALDSVSNVSSNKSLDSSSVPVDPTPNSNQNGNGPIITPTPTPMPNTGGNSSSSTSACPNLPSGATVVMETPFNTPDGEGQLWEVYPGAGKIMQPTGANGNASASILSAGQATGGQQTIWPKPGKEQALTNLYMCMRFKMNEGFVGQQTANKLFFIAAQDFTFGKIGANGFFGLGQNGAYPPDSFYLYFGHNTSVLNNDHTCQLELGLLCDPNINKTIMFPDIWYTIEAYVESSTCTTCRNGTVKWWINGQLNGSYTNTNYSDGIINQWQLNHTWDGGGAVQCGPPTNPSNIKGRDCRRDQIYYFDNVVLAAKGGRAPAGK